MLSPGTWPSFNGAPKDGCAQIMDHQAIGKEEFQLGKTKIFIRNPLTVIISLFIYLFQKNWF